MSAAVARETASVPMPGSPASMAGSGPVSRETIDSAAVAGNRSPHIAAGEPPVARGTTRSSSEPPVANEAARSSGEASVSRETAPVGHSVAARLVLLPIRAYRRFLSPGLGARCRYYPTCSAYAEQSIRELGALRGTILAIWRVLRCNPLSNGGLDPVSERRFFRSTGHAHAHAEGDSA